MMLRQSLSEKEHFPRRDCNLPNLDRRPARYCCRHQGLYETKVLRCILYLNLRVVCIGGPLVLTFGGHLAVPKSLCKVIHEHTSSRTSIFYLNNRDYQSAFYASSFGQGQPVRVKHDV